MPIVALALGVGLVIALIASAAALTYTAICMIAGAGAGAVATLLVGYEEFLKYQRREDQRREREAWEREQEKIRDHQRMIEIIRAVKGGDFDKILSIDDRRNQIRQIEGKK